MAFSSVFIAGPTGQLGKPVTEAFLNKKIQVKILSRPENKDQRKATDIHNFQEKGAIVVEASLDDIESLKTALQGVDVVVSTLSGAGIEPQLNLVRAAAAAGVKRFVPSEFGCDIEAPLKQFDCAYLKAKDEVRKEVQKTDMEYVWINCGFFYSLFATPVWGIDLENGKAVLGGDGSQKFGCTDVADVARVTADVALHPHAKNRSVIIQGDRITFEQLLQVFEDVTGKKIERKYQSIAELQKRIEGETYWVLIYCLQLQQFAAAGIYDEKPNFREFSNEKLKTLKEYAEENLRKK